MMPLFRLADLSHAQMMALEQMEHELGVTLVAYEPTDDAQQESMEQSERDLIMDGLVDTYRTHDPH